MKIKFYKNYLLFIFTALFLYSCDSSSTSSYNIDNGDNNMGGGSDNSNVQITLKNATGDIAKQTTTLSNDDYYVFKGLNYGSASLVGHSSSTNIITNTTESYDLNFDKLRIRRLTENSNNDNICMADISWLSKYPREQEVLIMDISLHIGPEQCCTNFNDKKQYICLTPLSSTC